MAILVWLIAGVLFALSVLHLYWVAGGSVGVAAAIPSDGSQLLFKPGKPGTAMVAVGLALCGWFVLELGNVAGSRLIPEWLFPFGGWLLAGIFIVRAIGDFRWVGFFKKKRGTLFASRDTQIYSPLCLLLGIGIIAIQRLWGIG